MSRILCCVFPGAPTCEDHFEFSAGVPEVVSSTIHPTVQVKLLANPDLTEFKAALDELKPTVVYLAGPTAYEQNKIAGTVEGITFRDGSSSDALFDGVFTGKEVELVFFDCKVAQEHVKQLQSSGTVASVVTWSLMAANTGIPSVVAAQFAHTFLTLLVSYGATPYEAFALASHITQAHLTTLKDGQYYAPALPTMLSQKRAALPDNDSIPAPEIPGVDPSVPIATAVPGWADVRLLAPRAELRLLLCGGQSMIDGTRLAFLGEALRALLVMEMRTLTLVATTPCPKVPANLPLGCTAVRCELRSASGRYVSVVLGGQPAVLADMKLVEYALRMTLVSDALSLQFRLPPPTVPPPMPRQSSAAVCGAPVVDSMVLTSVWVVQVLRALCQDPRHKALVSMGLGAVGGTSTLGASPVDAHRIAIMAAGAGPMNMQMCGIIHPAAVAAQEAAAAQAQAAMHMGMMPPGMMMAPGMGQAVMAPGQDAYGGEQQGDGDGEGGFEGYDGEGGDGGGQEGL